MWGEEETIAKRNQELEIKNFELLQELSRIKNSGLYSILISIKKILDRSIFYKIFKNILISVTSINNLASVQEGYIRISGIDKKRDISKGQEIWLLAINPDDETPIDLLEGVTKGKWVANESSFTPSGKLLYLAGGRGSLKINAGRDPVVLFQSHEWSGFVEVEFAKKKLQIDLFSEQGEVVKVNCKEGEISRHPSLCIDDYYNKRFKSISATPSVIYKETIFTDQDSKWLSEFLRKPKALSIITPDWIGIKNATRELFDEIYEIPDNLTDESGLYYAKLFSNSKAPAIVFQGFPLTYRHLVKHLRRLSPTIPLYDIWHGGFIQINEDYDWQGIQLLKSFSQSGDIKKWGFVKKGMEKVISSVGIESGFIMNMVRKIPSVPSIPFPDGPNIGIWGSWRKLPFVMMSSCKLVTNAKVVVWGADDRVKNFGKFINLHSEMHDKLAEPDSVKSNLESMDINLYVSLYECAPMLPLESLSVGSPCIFGPHSHYFDDNEYLYSRLVVPAPDRADIIANKIEIVLNERNEIIKNYCEYAVGYNFQAKKSLMDFLELDYYQIWKE